MCSWTNWWDINGDRYLLPPDSNRAPAIPWSQLFPDLKRALDATEDHNIASACLVAIAKAGRDQADVPLRDVFVPRLRSRSLEVRETAALALGIAGCADPQSLDLLADLIGDTNAGRVAVGRDHVDGRIRCFSMHALGLLAHHSPDPDVKARVLAVLQPQLDPTDSTWRDRRVAAIVALGLLHPDVDTERGRALLDATVRALGDSFAAQIGGNGPMVRSHVLTAIARLLGNTSGDPALRARWIARLIAELEDRTGSRSSDCARSAALALGQMCSPWNDEHSASAPACAALLRQWREHGGPQTRSFALIALGQIGGRRSRSTLLHEFARTADAAQKPWAALALGVMESDRLAAARRHGLTPTADEEVGRALQQALTETRDPAILGSIAVALGLCRFPPAVANLQGLLRQHAGTHDLADFLCTGLALTGDEGSRDEIRRQVEASFLRHEALVRAAIALGRLGDTAAIEPLLRMLADGGHRVAALAAIATTLGSLGDAGTVPSLIGMLHDEQLPELSRAFAAAALGCIGSRDRLPWNFEIGANMNYRAMVETMLDGGAGILEIL